MNTIELVNHFKERDKINKELTDFVMYYCIFNKNDNTGFLADCNLKITLSGDNVFFQRFRSGQDEYMEIDEFYLPFRYLETDDWKGLILKEREEYKQKCKEIKIRQDRECKIQSLEYEKKEFKRLLRKFKKGGYKDDISTDLRKL